MTFQAPPFLLLLSAVPLAVIGVLWFHRRRNHSGGEFASPALLPSVAPNKPGWRRYGALALYLAALTAVVVALARPEATVAVPDERAQVMLITDGSASMRAEDVKPSRVEAAREAADELIDGLPSGLRVGAVVFNDQVLAAQLPTRDHARTRAVLRGLRATGGTATGDGLDAGLDLIGRDRGRRRTPAALVLLSDGKSTSGRDPVSVATEAQARRIPIHTVALGTPTGTIEPRTPGGARRRVPPDTATLRKIAEGTGGKAFSADDRLELDAVYDELSERVGTRKEKREVTGVFAGAAGMLLAGGGLMSLLWFGRLP